MKRLTFNITASLFAATVLLTACSDRNNTSDSDAANNSQDSNLTDTRRNTTDTTNYLTNDTGNQSQDVIDPEPPQRQR